MAAVADRLKRRLLGRSEPAPSAPPLSELKKRTIDKAFALDAVNSVADLGGVWAVEAGYTFHALEAHAPERAVLVDDDITAGVRERARSFGQLELAELNFGTVEAAERVGDIGVVLLYDVLLHQVAPDWDEILARYAPRAQALAIVNPMYTASETTVRLLDLGRERYLEVVPPQENHTWVQDHLEEVNERRGRPWRDVHDIWQWGITDADLRAAASAHGMALVHHECTGPWRGLAHFDEHAYVFARG